MSTLHYLNYNNYQNRVLKGESRTLTTEYNDATAASDPYPGLNFNPNDGIDTYHVINDPNLTEFPFDYCLVTDDNSYVIKSKWFVMDTIFNRKRQWIVKLRRDVKADKYNSYKLKPFYCTKGMPASTSDPLIFNAEGREYNQILKGRFPLRDDADAPNRYIVGFLDKTWAGGSFVTQPCIKVKNYEDIFPNNQVQYWNRNTGIGNCPNLIKFGVAYTEDNVDLVQEVTVGLLATTDGASSYQNSDISVNLETAIPFDSNGQHRHYLYLLSHPSVADIKSLFGSTASQRIHFIEQTMKTAGGTNISAVTLKELTTPINDVAKGKNFYLENTDTYIQVDDPAYTLSGLSYIDLSRQGWYDARDIIGYHLSYSSLVDHDKTDAERFSFAGISFAVNVQTPIWQTTILPKITIGANRPHIDNVPYDIFVLEDTPVARAFATNLASFIGGESGVGESGVLYDLQLFPYKLQYDDNDSTTRINVQPNPNLSPVYLHWAKSDSNSGNIDLTNAAIAGISESDYDTLMELKIGSEQHMCRLVSPDGGAAWEFNPAMLGGLKLEDGLRYEFTVMPFSSYLHIWPKFKSMYGIINKTSDIVAETRGLICTVSYSIPYSTNNWSLYKLQNSAYLDSFNRQIDNMKVGQEIQRAEQKINMVTAPITGLFGGAMGGGAGGALMGPILGGVGAWADYQFGEIEREEALNYTKDQFYNSLRNIKAQPNPLTHASTTAIGVAWFPMLEVYKATSNEETILTNDIKVHGYTLGFLTTFSTMQGRATAGADTRYIQGHLLQVVNDDDQHIMNEVMKELEKGVYINDV